MMISWDSVGLCNVFLHFRFHVRLAIENDISDVHVNPFTIFYCGPNLLSVL